VDRGMQDKIAEQLVDSEIDFFAGGGTSFFSNRKDSLDLIKKLSENGFVVKTDTTSKKLDHDNKYGFLLAENGMPTMLESRGDFLPEYTKLALDLFSQQQKSFFLMVEGSQIDWAGHEGNADYLIAEVLDFDKTVGVAMDFAANNNNTLVIVLADHETGGFTLAIKDGDYSIIKPTFASSGHSCTLIPVLASGPGAESFKGIYQNNEIFHKILAVTN
jgi:alkaline phosphatase